MIFNTILQHFLLIAEAEEGIQTEQDKHASFLVNVIYSF